MFFINFFFFIQGPKNIFQNYNYPPEPSLKKPTWCFPNWCDILSFGQMSTSWQESCQQLIAKRTALWKKEKKCDCISLVDKLSFKNYESLISLWLKMYKQHVLFYFLLRSFYKPTSTKSKKGELKLSPQWSSWVIELFGSNKFAKKLSTQQSSWRRDFFQAKKVVPKLPPCWSSWDGELCQKVSSSNWSLCFAFNFVRLQKSPPQLDHCGKSFWTTLLDNKSSQPQLDLYG